MSALLNDGPGPKERQQKPASLESARDGAVLAPRPYADEAHIIAGKHPMHDQQTPPYAQALGSGRSYGKGPTPNQTPSGQHHVGVGQYPFPQQPPSQSPVAPTPTGSHQYRPYEAHSPLTTGLGRPPSHGNVHTQPPYTQAHQYAPPRSLQHMHSMQSNASLSPTPSSSHHSQTPVRQSPLSSASYPLNQHLPQPYQSHPSTPLGPPPMVHKAPHQPDFPSPYHQRTLSNTSTGLHSGSPAQHRTGIGNLVESPSMLNRPSPPSRRTSGYQQSIERERERSISVSPKTKLPPRPPSMNSRHSSQQELYSARSSVQPIASVVPPAGQSHVYAPQPSYASPQDHELNRATPQAPTPLPNLSAGPTPSVTNPRLKAEFEAQSSQRPHLVPQLEHVHPSSPSQSQRMNAAALPINLAAPPSLKRPADSAPSAEPPARRLKTRKYSVRPPWAQLGPRNPRYQTDSRQHANGTAQPKAAGRTNGTTVEQRPEAEHAQRNAPRNDLPNDVRDQPLDRDLMLARQLISPDWEKTFTNKTPIPGITLAVCDWLFNRLNANADIGVDPLQGAIEIEAKIGTLISVDTDQRIRTPFLSPAVLDPAVNSQFRFESQMDERQHQQMNQFLNQTLVNSRRPGRTQIDYKHIYETDSFAVLNETGLRALPKVLHTRPFNKSTLKLRTSVDTKSHVVKARIVKLPLDNLHIHCPNAPYDCRISMNLEVNLDRPDIDIGAITRADDPGGAPPSRIKDRMSYRHLAYSIDLTKVDVAGLPPKYELELELDAGLLRSQIARLQRREESAYMSVVEGFLDNAMFLMRQSPP